MHKIKMQAHNSAEWSSCISSKCVCDYMRVRLNTHTHTHPLHMYGVVCLFLQECMPICVCVLPMKDILYMCECYSCPPPLAASKCVSSRCEEVRAGLPSTSPDVSRCGLRCHTCMHPWLSSGPGTGCRVGYVSRFSGCLSRTKCERKIFQMSNHMNFCMSSKLICPVDVLLCGSLYSNEWTSLAWIK